MISISLLYQIQIEKLRQDLKKDPITQELFDQYDVSINELNHIPMFFAKLPVSARTEHGIIYFNLELIEQDGEPNLAQWKKNYHYAHHELTHYLQQTTGSAPTKGSTEDSYLDNEFEQEGFQEQSKFISHHHGEEEAEDYIEQVLDHHEIDGQERKEKKQELLQFASKRQKPKQTEFDFSEPEVPLTKDDLQKILQEIEVGKPKPPIRSTVYQLSGRQKEQFLENLQKLREAIEETKKIASEIDLAASHSSSAYDYKLKMLESLMQGTNDSTRRQILNQVMNDYFDSAYSSGNEVMMQKIEQFLAQVDQANLHTLPFSQLKKILRAQNIANLQTIVFSKISESDLVNLYDSSSEMEKIKLQQILAELGRKIPGIPAQSLS